MSLLDGVFVAAITPRRADGPHVDLAAMLELVDWICAARAQGIALFGSTGEFIHFDIAERLRVQALAVRRSRLPVVVNVSHSTLDGAVRLAAEASAAGAAGLLLMPPTFFQYGQGEIAEFYRQFVREAGKTPPLLLYNIPMFTSGLDAATAVELLESGLAAGIKDSSGQWDYFLALKALRRSKEFTLFIGNDVVFTRGRIAGANGVVSGVACAVPELVTGLDAAIRAGDEAKTARLDALLQEFIAKIDGFPAPVGVRAAAEARGVRTGPLNTPLSRQKEIEMAQFREWFSGWWKGVAKEAA